MFARSAVDRDHTSRCKAIALLPSRSASWSCSSTTPCTHPGCWSTALSSRAPTRSCPHRRGGPLTFALARRRAHPHGRGGRRQIAVNVGHQSSVVVAIATCLVLRSIRLSRPCARSLSSSPSCSLPGSCFSLLVWGGCWSLMCASWTRLGSSFGAGGLWSCSGFGSPALPQPLSNREVEEGGAARSGGPPSSRRAGLPSPFPRCPRKRSGGFEDGKPRRDTTQERNTRIETISRGQIRVNPADETELCTPGQGRLTGPDTQDVLRGSQWPPSPTPTGPRTSCANVQNCCAAAQDHDDEAAAARSDGPVVGRLAWPSLAREAVAQTTQDSGSSICYGPTLVSPALTITQMGRGHPDAPISVGFLPPFTQQLNLRGLRDSLSLKRA